MGAGIAEVLARAGHPTQLQDLNDELLASARQRIEQSLLRAQSKQKITSEEAQRARENLLQHNQPELILEAVVEDIQVKINLLQPLSHQYPKAILASNTSSLSLTQMAAACHRPERVIGMHFFNPPPIMELLEIVSAEQTDDATLRTVEQLARQLGKTPIVVKDVAGFASSRLGIILGMEAIRMLESGVASASDIDKAMELGYRHPMGPLKLTDLVGLDVRLAIAEHLSQEIGPQFTPPPLLRRLVRAGRLGKKTGHGFYRWKGNEAT
jgi:3-hydroxybutyryl-CoA dehydrogenase